MVSSYVLNVFVRKLCALHWNVFVCINMCVSITCAYMHTYIHVAQLHPSCFYGLDRLSRKKIVIPYSVSFGKLRFEPDIESSHHFSKSTFSKTR